ncbi:CDP-glycerol glycerophosphotransferase family protein [Geodermatophilus sp. SYSU D00703]
MRSVVLKWGASLGPLAVLHLLLAVAALLPSPTAFVVALAATVGLEAWIAARLPTVTRALDLAQFGRPVRWVVRIALLLVLALRADGGPGWLPVAVLLCAVVLVLGRALVADAARELRARSVWPLQWRHLEVPALALPAEHPLGRWLRAVGPEAVYGADLLVAGGLLAVLYGGAPGWLPAAGALVVLVDATVALTLRWRVRRLPVRERDDVVAAVREALEVLAPRVVVYFGGPPTSTHALNTWVPVLERLDEPVLVMVRQGVHLEQLDSRRLPALCVPRATDVEGVVVPSMSLALYPTNIVQNNHLIRVPGITDVFIGHGDSDKGGSSTPISRIYDEVWVAGPAGRERYRTARVGVRDEQIREVGRPQLSEIARVRGHRAHDPARPFTVLYAPTWEGFYAAWSYSSLLPMGEEIVTRLMAMDGVRVLVKPHPASGSVDKAYRGAAERVVAAVRRRGAPHAAVDGLSGLYGAFNEADLLVTDVSSVVTDFLWSGKPYVMTNPQQLAEDEYRREFPSSAGAALWDPALSTLEADVLDASGGDRRRPERECVRRHLLGDDDGDPQDRFAAAVRDVVRSGPLRTNRPEPAPGSTVVPSSPAQGDRRIA